MTEDEENTFLFELQRADTDAENEKLKKQLTEAKEIIRELLNIIDYLNEDEYGKEDFPVVHKAESFLNSEVAK